MVGLQVTVKWQVDFVIRVNDQGLEIEVVALLFKIVSLRASLLQDLSKSTLQNLFLHVDELIRDKEDAQRQRSCSNFAWILFEL